MVAKTGKAVANPKQRNCDISTHLDCLSTIKYKEHNTLPSSTFKYSKNNQKKGY